MTRREVRRLLEQAKENEQDGTDEGDPDTVAVELGGVPARGPEEGGPRPGTEGASYEAFRVDLETGEVETPDLDGGDPGICENEGCDLPAIPDFGDPGPSSLKICGRCSGLPRRDWPPRLVDAVENTEEGDGGGHE